MALSTRPTVSGLTTSDDQFGVLESLREADGIGPRPRDRIDLDVLDEPPVAVDDPVDVEPALVQGRSLTHIAHVSIMNGACDNFAPSPR
jgi:hypothetical protein